MNDPEDSELFRVRTVTFFKHLESLPVSDDSWRSLVELMLSELQLIRRHIESRGISVQMIRLATNIMEHLVSEPFDDMIEKAVRFEKGAVESGLPVLNLGTIRDRNFIHKMHGLSGLMRHLQTSFFSVSWADNFGMAEALALSREIIAMEKNEPGSNFRFGIIFNCMGGIPYFPAAYADTSHINGAFALGIENSHLLQHCYQKAQEVCKQVDPMNGPCPMGVLEDTIIKRFTEVLQPLENCVMSAATDDTIEYLGIDTSIAPDLGGPNHNMEKCLTMLPCNGLPSSIHRPWSAGTAATIDVITRSIKSLDLKKCGYCGVMLPVLENDSLAAAAEREELTIQKLLLYSNMCGVGLDVLPVPGTGVEAQYRIAALLLDVAAISNRHKKPLSVRLLPVFDSSPGQKTNFDFNPYIINGTVMDF